MASKVVPVAWSMLNLENYLRQYTTPNELFTLTQFTDLDSLVENQIPVIARIFLRVLAPERFPCTPIPSEQCDQLLKEIQKSAASMNLGLAATSIDQEEKSIEKPDVTKLQRLLRKIFEEGLTSEELAVISAFADKKPVFSNTTVLTYVLMGYLRMKGDTVLDVAMPADPYADIKSEIVQEAFEKFWESLGKNVFFGCLVNPGEESVTRLMNSLAGPFNGHVRCHELPENRSDSKIDVSEYDFGTLNC